jgi:thiol:disulfide interchange protein
MEKPTKPRLDVSTILVNLLAIGFLLYIAWMLRDIGSHLRAVAVYSLMMPKFISIWRAFKRCDKITDTEQWVFIIIALVLWIVQSFLTGKLHNLIS